MKCSWPGSAYGSLKLFQSDFYLLWIRNFTNRKRWLHGGQHRSVTGARAVRLPDHLLRF